MPDETETSPVPETPAPAPAPAPSAPVPEPPAPKSGFFDKVAIAPFYLLALVVGWCVASLFSGNGFATPSWLRSLALWVFFLGAVWSVVFRDRVARPAGYAGGCALLFVLVALFLPHGSLEERVARKALDSMVAAWRAEGYDVSLESLALDEEDDGSLGGTALLRSGRQLFEFGLSAVEAETEKGYEISVTGLDEAENPRLTAIRALAGRHPVPAASDPPAAEEKPAE